MIERFEDMPAGTIDFEFGGDVTTQEYREMLERRSPRRSTRSSRARQAAAADRCRFRRH